jgi:hypothetical protein
MEAMWNHAGRIHAGAADGANDMNFFNYVPVAFSSSFHVTVGSAPLLHIH